jgi:hypothetical protein
MGCAVYRTESETTSGIAYNDRCYEKALKHGWQIL